MRPLPWMLLSVGCYLVGHLVRGERCRRLLQGEATLSLATASNIVVVGYAANNVFPARLGELVRAGMLVERTGIPFAHAFTVTFVERLLDGIAILVLLIVASIGMPLAGWLGDLEAVASLVLGIAFLGLLGLLLVPGLFLVIGSRAAMRLRHVWHGRVVRLITSVSSGVAPLKRPRTAVVVAALSIVIWLFESGMFFFVLVAFDLPPDPRMAIVVMCVTNLGILIPSTPGFVGPFHFFCARALMSFGVAEPIALSYAFLVHLAFFVPVTIWGAGAMLWYGVQVGATAAAARAARSSTETAVLGGVRVHAIADLVVEHHDETTSPLFIALAEAHVPIPAARIGEERETVARVAAFMQAQIAALPTRLRWLFGVGLLVFRFWVRVRYFRSVCGLPLEKRRAAVGSWAYGRIPTLRQFFRPLRSTALLAYYDGLPEFRVRSVPAPAHPLPLVQAADG